MKFTVLLKYPDYANDMIDYDVIWVHANDEEEACEKARLSTLPTLEASELKDARVLAVFHGHLNNVNPE